MSCRIWDAESAQPLFDDLEPFLNADPVWSPDGTKFLMCGDKRDSGIWDAKTGLKIQQFPRFFQACAFSSDGKLAAIGLRGFRDGYTVIWKVQPDKNAKSAAPNKPGNSK